MKPGWVETERTEWMKRQEELVNEEKWIIDGNYGGTLDLRLNHADTIIFLDYSTVRCLYGVVKRRLQYHGKIRPDMGESCPEKLDLEFLKWVYHFRKQQSPQIIKKLNIHSEKSVYHLKTPKETQNLLRSISI